MTRKLGSNLLKRASWADPIKDLDFFFPPNLHLCSSEQAMSEMTPWRMWPGIQSQHLFLTGGCLLTVTVSLDASYSKARPRLLQVSSHKARGIRPELGRTSSEDCDCVCDWRHYCSLAARERNLSCARHGDLLYMCCLPLIEVSAGMVSSRAHL